MASLRCPGGSKVTALFRLYMCWLLPGSLVQGSLALSALSLNDPSSSKTGKRKGEREHDQEG